MSQRAAGARVLVLAALVAAIVAVAWAVDARALVPDILRRIDGLGAWGPVLFVGLYVAATVLFVPGVILTLGAGAVFGLVKGAITVSVAATLGATAAFLVGRYLARDVIARKLQAWPRFLAIDAAVAREGWKIVGLLRLSPVFPFNLLNYAFGLTRVSLRDYVLASWAGMLPATVLYVYLGSLAGQLAAVAADDPARPPGQWALTAVGLIATVAATAYIARLARRALAQHIPA